MNEGKMRRPHDPAADSALLLQRIGFFTLGVALPVSAMLSRRAAVVLAPIGVALLVIASLLTEPDRFARSLRRRSVKATALALVMFLLWTALSTVWGVRGATASATDRILNMALALALGVAGIAALPERMRAANLYAVAVGIGASALLAFGMAASGFNLGSSEDDEILIVRGLALSVILGAPVAGWLLLRGRTRAAAALILTLALAAILAGSAVLAAALTVAVASFAFVTFQGVKAVRIMAWLAVLVIMLAPLAALVAPPVLSALGLGGGAALANWAVAIAKEPAKLITGHGFGAALAQMRSGALPTPAPNSIVFEIWHELGLVGAAAFAAVLWFAIRAVLVLPTMLQAGAIAAYAAALCFGVMGLASLRAWWLMTIAAGVILTTALARGQGRNDRPIAAFVRKRTQGGDKAGPGADQAAMG